MATPGLLYVNSNINSPLLTQEAFTKWYEEIHIPDIFVTSGIKSAFRYKSPIPDMVERPYLALYPLKDLGFLQSAEFKSIPVQSETLPSPGKTIFELADFDTRYYKLLKEEDQAGAKAPSRSILNIAFDSDSTDPDTLLEETAPTVVKPKRSRLYELTFSRHNRRSPEERGIPVPPKYLVLHEFDTLSQEDFAQVKAAKKNAMVFKFDLLKAFGDF